MIETSEPGMADDALFRRTHFLVARELLRSH